MALQKQTQRVHPGEGVDNSSHWTDLENSTDNMKADPYYTYDLGR